MLRRALLACVLALGCGDDGGSVGADASVADAARPPVDAAGGTDGEVPLAWVDFAITGCADGDSDAGVPGPCVGTAPLALSFTAISPAEIDIYRWSFGDGTPQSTTASPAHVYAEPGTYDVALAVGGPGGTASQSKSGAVVVQAASLGAPCSTDATCGGGLECVCDAADGCGDVLTHGLCAADCTAASCAEGVCAELDRAGAGGADWRRELCLVACTGTGDCPAGLTCQDLRTSGGDWVRGCFAPGVLGAIGDACADASGAPDDAACASGSCLAIGARGTCSAVCTGGDCPAGAACATFGGGLGPACIDRCEDASSCDDDPWLACEAPGGSGDLGFTVDEAAEPEGYCAPRTCTGAPGECGPDGTCVSGFCAAAP